VLQNINKLNRALEGVVAVCFALYSFCFLGFSTTGVVGERRRGPGEIGWVVVACVLMWTCRSGMSSGRWRRCGRGLKA